MKANEIAEMAVKDIAAAKESNIDFENPLPFGNAPINLDTPVAFEDIQRFREEMDYFDAEYVQHSFNSGSTLTPNGSDYLFGNIRIFVESPDYANNKTGKYCLVMYTMPGFKEVRRVVVGGSKKVSSWNYVASIFRNWINEILMTLEHHLVA